MQTPCPHRIIDDMGSAFAMGCIGGGLWHGVKGFRNAPRGFRMRSYGSLRAIQSRSPVLGGNFAVWGLSFSCFDCIFSTMRKKDDPLNAIMAGTCTGGVLAWRAGWRSASRNAIIGGVLLAMIEGLGIALGKMFQPGDQQMQGPISPYSQQQGKKGGSSSGPSFGGPPPPQEDKWDAEDDFDLDVVGWGDDDFMTDPSQDDDEWR